MEIKVTDTAVKKINEAVKENDEVPALRIYVEKAACKDARFGIAFDDPKEKDVITEINGIEFITDTDYVPLYADGIDIDYVETPSEGFIIKPLRRPRSSCGSCGGCSGCGH